jgi:hypothetical protein
MRAMRDKTARTMPRSRKINLEKVRASLDAVCPKCGGLIPPADVRRIDFERIECPVRGERFMPHPHAFSLRDI